MDHSALKTVVVSACGDLDNIRTAMNRGAFDFVTKPIDFTDLEATIRKTFGHLEEFCKLNRQRAEAESAKALLPKYFSLQVAETLASGKGQIGLGGERREATFLFTDLASFNSLVEGTDPDVIVELLNGYLDSVAKIIFAHDGTGMKVIGDAVNTAARLEAANKTLGTRICASESVANNIDGFLGRPAGRLMLQGKSEPPMTFEPMRLDVAAATV